MGEKTYDDRLYIGTAPFYGLKWWRCDPWCKPKRGDWVCFWICLKKKLTDVELDTIFNKIDEVEKQFKDTIVIEAKEYSWALPDIKFVVGFKKDSPYSLHDWMYNYFCSAFNNECGKPYAERTYIEWINYMGIDQDFPVWEVTFTYEDGTTKKSSRTAKLSPNESVKVTIKNYGRVPGKAYILIRDWKDGYRFIDCFEVSVGANGSWSNTLSLEVVDPPDFWLVTVGYFVSADFCANYQELYTKSPNKLVIGEKPPTVVQKPKCIFVDKATEAYIVIEQTGEQFYPGSELTVFYGATLLCCGLIKNEGADGECGMFVFDKNSGKYLDGVTKFLKSGEMWLASVELTPQPGDYELVFHATHREGDLHVVDDEV